MQETPVSITVIRQPEQQQVVMVEQIRVEAEVVVMLHQGKPQQHQDRVALVSYK